MIEAFIGYPGVGKTYLMTRLALKLMKKEEAKVKKAKKKGKEYIPRKLYANYNIKGATKYNQIEELFDVTNAIILIDEAGLVAPAGFWKAIPFDVLAHWRQHRHGKIDIWYTAQSLEDVATALRRVTQFVNRVKKLGWLMTWKTYDPQTKEKFGGGWHIFDMTIANKYDSYGENVAKQDFLKDM